MQLVDARRVAAKPAKPDKFTSGVWQQEILGEQIPNGMRAHRFTYPAGAHSHWHSHEGEQSIFVESGRGWVKLEGEEGFEVLPGELVYVPKDTKHWHGATPTQVFVHLAFTAMGETAWLGEVTNQEYEAGFS
jgi:quercetin dioxygenase-like cupin family protein